ncbi:TetR family transcriptional regulator [Streptomyces sp. YC504]|uniref:TetR family transcriptional regulator n=1 Tax=Streptomyces mesophilus TaxID=1775132 RepID=A0A6G4XJ34_9ACTN|nr:TetR family transcriptional regulator [Streptomyces mesophilus]NGO77192.1 TetR family transcriptional regulator [Streptomyces mesophilus]
MAARTKTPATPAGSSADPSADPSAGSSAGSSPEGFLAEFLGARNAQLGLRERKKHATRTAIRKATYALIEKQGYEAATIEQIARDADVSPSTVFRYFATKEDIVLTDEYDPVMLEVLRERPAGEPPLASLRFLLTETVKAVAAHEPEELKQRSRLIVEVPAVRARMTETMAQTSQALSVVLAERTGREPDDLDVRMFTAAVLGALREAMIYWGEREFEEDLLTVVLRAFDLFERGLAL